MTKTGFFGSLLAFTILMGCAVHIIHAQTPVSGATPQKLDKSIVDNIDQRHAIVVELMNEASTIIARRKRIDFLDSKGQRAADAIVEIGKLCAYEQAEGFLEVEVETASGATDTVYSRYPAVHALSDIGTPALPALLTNFSDRGLQSQLPLVSAVVFRALGKPVGLAYLKDFQTKVPKGQARANMAKLIAYFEVRSPGELIAGY